MTAQQEIKAMKKEIGELKSLVADSIEGTAKNGNGNSFFSGHDLKDMAHDAGKSVSEYLHEKGTQARELRDNCRTGIKRRPLTSAALAFTGGVVIASLLSRRS